MGKDPRTRGGWDWEHYSQISLGVSLCDRAVERKADILWVFILCVCAGGSEGGGREGGGGKEASGEKREMKRMNVPLRKCHTGKICRF